MLKLAVVGDLSQNDPSRLAQALDAALGVADVVVHVGDINPGYDVVKQRLPQGKLLCIPGNHDTQGPGNRDASLPGLPKQWKKSISGITLIGIDNTNDTINPDGWALLNAYEADQSQPLFSSATSRCRPSSFRTAPSRCTSWARARSRARMPRSSRSSSSPWT